MASNDLSDPHRLLTIQFLAWVAARPRSYAQVMEAWRSTCPRISIWEDAVIDGLVDHQGDGDRTVRLTRRGRAMLDGDAATSDAGRKKIDDCSA